ncbi:pimeloyl-ACP methyl ester carboxylesterase [Marisediminicola sp. UYEF4]|uniref:alpha/beta fold hydrolase n=1 Tax=Marisediminicola sp. UYEF4 TaxID=1756384 RepID=UPI00339A5431
MPSAVILVHGLRTSATMWRQQVEDLTARGLPVLAVDLPGHGSRLGERFTLEAAITVIDEAVTEATVTTGRPPYLVGFSLGGYLAIEWAAQHPGRVTGLLAAGCGTVPRSLVMNTWRVIAKVIHAFPDRGRALNDFAVRVFVPSPGAGDIIAGGVALEVMDDVLRALLRLRPLASLGTVAEPVLFVNGQFDHVGLQAGRFLSAARRGHLVTVPRATHMVSATHPAQFTAALLDGYSAVSATPSSSRLPDAGEDW